MPLESCVMCLDLSDYMRNGDYPPSRLDAQYDAACLLGGAKLQQNPESSVGVLASGGKGVNILASPTADLGKLLACLHGLKASGASSLITAIKTAQLALKHRKNRNGAQRIVIFVGSPVEEEERELTRLGGVLKKSSIAVDVIAMGENENNATRLRALIDAANSGGNSRLLVVPAGVMPSDVLAGHAILLGEDAAGGQGGAARGGAAGGAGGGFAEFGGVDPAMDPELAMALRVSMEEARAAARDPAADAAAGPGAAAATPAGAATAAAMDLSEEELLLQQALALSAEVDAPAAPAPAPVDAGAAAAAPVVAASSATGTAGVGAGDAAAPAPPAAEAAAAPAAAAGPAPFANPDFVQSLLGGLPGVDMSDPDLQAALAALTGGGAPPPPGGGGDDAEAKK